MQVKFSRIAWTRDGRGFFYSRFPAPRLVPKFVVLFTLLVLKKWQLCSKLQLAMLVLVSREGGGAMDSGIKTDVNLNHEVYYHFLGTEQSQDVLCWRDPDHPKYIYIPEVTEDGKVC